jgi:hypothetical protein
MNFEEALHDFLRRHPEIGTDASSSYVDPRIESALKQVALIGAAYTPFGESSERSAALLLLNIAMRWLLEGE